MLLPPHTQQHQLSSRSCYFVKGIYRTWRHCLRGGPFVTYWYVNKRSTGLLGMCFIMAKHTTNGSDLETKGCYCLTHTVCDFFNQYIRWWERQRHKEANQQFPKVHARLCDCDRKQHRCSTDNFLCVKDPPDTEAHTDIPHQRILYKHQSLTTTFLFRKKKIRPGSVECEKAAAVWIWLQQLIKQDVRWQRLVSSPSWVGHNILKRTRSLDHFHLTWGV